MTQHNELHRLVLTQFMRWVIRDHGSVFLRSIIVFFSDFLCACHILVQCRVCVTLSLHCCALFGHLFLSACLLSLSLSRRPSSSLHSPMISSIYAPSLTLCVVVRVGAMMCQNPASPHVCLCALRARVCLGLCQLRCDCVLSAFVRVCVSVCLCVCFRVRNHKGTAVNSPA